MTWVNDDQNSPLRFIEGGVTVGQFWNSSDGLYHLAEYQPYAVPPSVYVCGGRGNFSPSRNDRHDRAKCHACWEVFDRSSGDA